jgi:hypothetical protein
MSFTNPYSSNSTQPSMGPLQDGDMQIYASHVNSGLIDAHADRLTLEAAPGYDQVRI